MARSLFETRPESAGFWDRLKAYVPGHTDEMSVSSQSVAETSEAGQQAARMDARGRQMLIASVLVAGMGGR